MVQLLYVPCNLLNLCRERNKGGGGGGKSINVGEEINNQNSYNNIGKFLTG